MKWQASIAKHDTTLLVLCKSEGHAVDFGPVQLDVIKMKRLRLMFEGNVMIRVLKNVCKRFVKTDKTVRFNAHRISRTGQYDQINQKANIASTRFIYAIATASMVERSQNSYETSWSAPRVTVPTTISESPVRENIDLDQISRMASVHAPVNAFQVRIALQCYPKVSISRTLALALKR